MDWIKLLLGLIAGVTIILLIILFKALKTILEERNIISRH
jgi:hypothetical protein